MGTIAKLSAVVTANAKQFENTFDKIGQRFDRFKSHINKVVAPANKFRAVLGAIGVTALGYFLVRVVNAQIELGKFARKLGESVANVIALRHALRQTGADAELADKALTTLVHLISAGMAGGIAENSIFARLGLDLQNLSRLTPTQQFAEIVQALTNITDENQRAALAVQIFGDDAAALLPILSSGKRGLDAAAAAAKAMGMAFGDNELTELQNAKIEYENMIQAVQALGVQIARGLVPWVKALNNEFQTSGQNGMATFNIAKSVAKGVGYVYVTLNNMVRVITTGFGFVKLGAITVAYVIIKIVQLVSMAYDKMLWGLAQLPGAAGRLARETRQHWGKVKDEIQAISDGLKQFGDESKDDLEKSLKGFMAFDDVDNMLNGLNVQIGENIALQNKLAKATGAVSSAFKNSELYKKGRQVAQDVATPFEKYRSTLTELDALLRSNAITWNEYAKAIGKATAELESAHGLSNISLPSAARLGSSESVSAINRANLQDSLKNKETPAERMARIQQQSLEIEKQQLEYMKKLADNAQKERVYAMPK